MRRLVALSLFFLCIIGAAWSQPPSAAQQAKSSGPVSIFKMGPGTTAPTLMPVDFSPAISNQCERKFKGKVEISLIVDAHGLAQNMLFLKPAVNDLDRVAILVAQMDRFTPATQAGTAIAVGQSLELNLESCLVSEVDSAGKRTYKLKLASVPTQKLKPYNDYPQEVVFATEQVPLASTSLTPDRMKQDGGSVSTPVPIISPQAEYSDEGLKKNINGQCLVSLYVDAYGLPQNLKLLRSLEPTLDQKALEAVDRYRFKPALRNKMEPVPVIITIEVNFRLGNYG
jgi:TonB family protein